MKTSPNPFVAAELHELTADQMQQVNGGGFEVIIEMLKDWLLSNQPVL
jgi:bacteriocin-like protein